MYSIRPATLADAERVAGRLRPEHRREAALVGLDGGEALCFSFRHAASCYAFHAGGEPLFLAGAMEPEALDNTALAWLAGTPEMDAHPYPILEASRWLLPRLHGESGAARLENHVPVDYRKARKFARWLGCGEGAVSVRSGVSHIHVFHDRGDTPE